jgi:hypothetical protein
MWNEEANRARAHLTLRTMIDIMRRRLHRGVDGMTFAQSSPWWPVVADHVSIVTEGAVEFPFPYSVLSDIGCARSAELSRACARLRDATASELEELRVAARSHQLDMLDDIESLIVIARLEAVFDIHGSHPLALAERLPG